MNVSNLVECGKAPSPGTSDQEAYERLYPALFDHYYKYWCPRGRERPALSDDEIGNSASRVTRTLETIEVELSERQLDTRKLTIVLFVGGNTCNGHAFMDDGKVVVWIPVETYSTDLLARIFLTHEIAHGLHYRASPEFYFHDQASKNHLGRQLITEGLATYVTAQVLGISDRDALWADYLSAEQADTWLAECRRRTPELRAFCRAHFSESDPGLGLFQANDPRDILHFRAGYFVGLSVIRDIAMREKLDILDLLRLERNRLESLVLEELELPG